MFKSITISNYKVFENLNLDGLSEINLITGMNNVGKTNLLESLFLLIGCGNIELVMRINTFRGLSKFRGNTDQIRQAITTPLFHNFNSDKPISIKGKLDDGSAIESVIKFEQQKSLVISPNKPKPIETSDPRSGSTGLELTMTFKYNRKTTKSTLFIKQDGIRVEPFPSELIFPGHFVSSYPPTKPEQEAELFGELEATGKVQALLESLKILEPKIERLAVIVNAGTPMIHADIGLKRMVPLPMMGDGVRRITKILLAIENSPGGVILVDDIEFGIHHSNIFKIWRALINASTRQKAQIFVTTHSYEWIRGAAEISEESFVSSMSLYRLERDNSQFKIVSYDHESLSSAIESDLEIR